MRHPRHRRREVLLVSALVAALFLGTILTSGLEEEESLAVLYGSGSTYGTVPGGLKGLYLLLSRSGLVVQRWHRPLIGAELPAGALLCLVAPSQPVGELERESVVRWVRGGGALLLAPAEATDGAARLAEDLGVRLLEILPGDEPADADPAVLPGTSRTRVTVGPAPGAGLPDVAEVDVADTLRLDPPAEARVLLRDPQGAVLVRLPAGDGEVTVLAGAPPLTNDGLTAGDGAVLADRLFRQLDAGGPVVFDEAHHGFGQGGGLLGLLLDHPAGQALCLTVVVLFLYLAARGRSFGRTRRSGEAPRRELAEQVRAFARLYRRAGARALALELLRRDARAALGERLTTTPAGEAALTRRAARLVALPEEQVQRALGPVGTGALDDRRMVSRARVLARIVERLRDGRGRTRPRVR